MIKVPKCAEWRRVDALPIDSPPSADALATQLTSIFARNTTAKLWPQQALALWHWATCGGLWGRLPVGSGKTLITLLAGWWVEGRCLVLVPARLRAQTQQAIKDYGRDWNLPNNLLVASYEQFQTVKGATLLDDLAPAGIVCDEAHALKNPRSARTRRFRRYIGAKAPKLMVLSGSFMRRSLMDYVHLMAAALRDGSPLPRTKSTAELWAQATDPGTEDWLRPHPGALISWCLPDQRNLPSLAAARIGLGNRVAITRGCLLSQVNPFAAPLEITHRPLVVPTTVTNAIKTLRRTWETPNGDLLTEATAVWRIERELACGFWYRWDPPPPKEWLERRRAWAKIVREYLGRNIRGVDSPLQVAIHLPQHRDLAAWKEIRDEYKIRVVPVWESEYMIRDAAQWVKEAQGLVWYEYQAVGEAIAKAAGVPCFGGGTQAGRDILTHTGPAAVSIAAHGTGRNLQRYHRSLVTAPPLSGLSWEQLLGRMHREGQTRTARYEVYLPTDRYCQAVARSISDAEAIAQSQRSVQRLQIATLDLPPEALSDD